MNYRIIAYFIGRILRLEAVFMAPALAISLYQGEHAAAAGFLIAMGALLLVGVPWSWKRPENRSFGAREGFVTVGLVWVVVSLFGALPFFFGGGIPSYVDAVFETVSGFTTTGASILTEVESMAMGLLYWRSFTHWLGGMGVLVFLLAIVPMTRGSGASLHLLRAESPGPQVGKLVPKMHQTAKILYGIYVALTLFQIVLLLAGGMPLFDAVTTAFGTAGTGGFAVKNDSMAGYSFYLQTVVTVFMAVFGINFNIFYLLLIREFAKAFFNEELRVYLGIMLGSIALVTVNISHLYPSVREALHHAAFQVSSIMTTTGFATADFNLWPEFSRSLLVLLMVLGACAGSTGGGIKTARLIILFKSVRNEVWKMLHPRSVKLARMDGSILDEGTLYGVNAYMAVYCIIVAVSALLVSFDNFSFETNVTAVFACLNNLGPGLGLVGPMGNYSAFSDFSKLVLTANMLIGRLEIFPILALLMPTTWRRG